MNHEPSLPDHRGGDAGTAVHRLRNLLVLLAILIFSVFCMAVTAKGLRFDGDLSRVLDGKGGAYATFSAFRRDFTDPSADRVIAVSAPDLGLSLGALESFLTDLQLTEGVVGTISLYSLPAGQGTGPFLSSEAARDLPGPERLNALLAGNPAAHELLSADRSLTLISVLADAGVDRATREAALAETLSWAEPPLEVAEIGLSAVNREISRALRQDQLLVSGVAILACLVLTLIVFRSWRTGLAAALPALFGLTWNLALLTLVGWPMDPLLVVVPVVLIVLAFADSVHIVHAIARLRETGGMALPTAIAGGLRETLPAAALTTATTAAAFLSMLALGNGAMDRLAWAGTVGLFVQLAAVLICVPVFIGLAGAKAGPAHQFARIRLWAAAALTRRRATILTGGLVLIVLLVLQSQSVAGFAISEDLPRNSAFTRMLARVETALPGAGRIYLRIDAADPAPGMQEADRARLGAVAQVLYGDTVAPGMTGEIERGGDLAARFTAHDDSAYALPVVTGFGLAGTAPAQTAQDLRARLAGAGLGDVTELTGFILISAEEMPRLVERLRRSFYAALVMVTLMIWGLTGSLRVALVSLVPNVIPILAVEAGLVLIGQPITMTGAIALTVAFGIAVDDTIHLLNRYRIARGTAVSPAAALETALDDSLAPILATSVIVAAGFAICIASQLPAIQIFGALVSMAVVLAVLADVFLFPSLLSRLMERDG